MQEAGYHGHVQIMKGLHFFINKQTEEYIAMHSEEERIIVNLGGRIRGIA